MKRPMRYEMKGEESLSKLLEYAGGFTSDAYKKNVNVSRKGDSEFQIYTVDNEDFVDFTLADGDSVMIDPIISRYENRVTVTGAVYRPGNYAINNSIKTVKDLINVVEGPREDAFLNRTILYREKEDLSQEMLAVDLGKLLRGEIDDIPLKKNDRLYVPSATELRGDYVIDIRG